MRRLFIRDGVNNLRNVHAWSHNNPHETSVTNFQKRFSVNVWCGVLGNRLIGPNMKTLVYETKVDPREAMRDRIFAAVEHKRNHPGNTASATQSLLTRAEYWITASGGHFEHLLKSRYCILVQLCSRLIPECTVSHVTSVLAMHVSYIVLGTLRTTNDMRASFFVVQINGFMSLTS